MSLENLQYPSPEEESYRIFGVVHIVVGRDGLAFIFEEKSAKESTGKKAGDISVLCETAISGESIADTAKRGFQEEFGMPLDELHLKTIRLGGCKFIDGVYAEVLVSITDEPNILEQKALENNGDGEVVYAGRCTINNLVQNQRLRLGVRNVLNAFSDKLSMLTYS